MLAYEAHGETYQVRPRLDQYQGGQPCLSFVDAVDGSLILKATVNLPEYPLPEGWAFIKNWSENEGVLDWLLATGMVSLVRGQRENIPTGNAMATVVVLEMGVILGLMS